MTWRLAVWSAAAALMLGVGCSADQLSSTTASDPGASSSAGTSPPSSVATTSPSIVSTTVLTEPDEPGLALTPYQLEMVGAHLELAVLRDFAEETHGEWEAQEAQLGTSERGELFRLTERRLMGLLRWMEELHTRVGALQSTVGLDSGYVTVRAAAARIEDAARSILDGLRLPSTAESTPGTARRQAMAEFLQAAADLDDAALAALGGDLVLSDYEQAMIGLRLEVAGLAYRADEVNRIWEDAEAGYRLTEWNLGNLRVGLLDVVDRVHLLEPPDLRRASFRGVEQACQRLETAAHGMLEGLQLPQSAEEAPGTMRRQSLDEFREGATEFDRAAALTLGTEETEWQPLPAAPAPRTAAPDTDPPPLAVTAPGFGSVVVEGRVSFSGATEPGAFVAVGDTAADVDQHGHWLAQLVLDPGDNVVTITAVDAAGNVTATKHEVRHEWVIRSDGIGPATGGDPPDQVVAQFVALFGPPTSDDMTEPTGLPFGYGAVSYARFTSWDAAGLFLAFTDGDYFRNDAKPGLISWGTTNPVFVTPEGIHVGSTMESLTAAYGSRLTVSTTDECALPGDFYVDCPGPEEPWVGFLQGHLSGPPFGPDSVVESLGGGFPSSC